MVIANLRGHLEFAGQLREGNPIAALDGPRVFIQRGILAHDHAVCRWIELQDIDGLRCREEQTCALADGEEFDPVVMAEDFALLIDDFAFMLFD